AGRLVDLREPALTVGLRVVGREARVLDDARGQLVDRRDRAADRSGEPGPAREGLEPHLAAAQDGVDDRPSAALERDRARDPGDVKGQRARVGMVRERAEQRELGLERGPGCGVHGGADRPPLALGVGHDRDVEVGPWASRGAYVARVETGDRHGRERGEGERGSGHAVSLGRLGGAGASPSGRVPASCPRSIDEPTPRAGLALRRPTLDATRRGAAWHGRACRGWSARRAGGYLGATYGGAVTWRVRWDELPLARGSVDRAAHLRSREDLLAELMAREGTRVVLARGARVAVRQTRTELDLRSPSDPVVTALAEHAQAMFLGTDDDGAYLALVHPAEPRPAADPEPGAEPDLGVIPGAQWQRLREVGHLLGPRAAGLAATAVALGAWHASHRFCARCGAPTEPSFAGWQRRCTAEGTELYPRTDPAVIMAVVDPADRILLAHATHWPERRFSTLAGFVEAGGARRPGAAPRGARGGRAPRDGPRVPRLADVAVPRLALARLPGADGAHRRRRRRGRDRGGALVRPGRARGGCALGRGDPAGACLGRAGARRRVVRRPA